MPIRRSDDPPIRLFAVGDVAFIGKMGDSAVADPNYPFANVRVAWKDADLVFANLETPLTNSKQRTRGKDPAEVAAGRDYILKSPPEAVKALRAGGVTIVSQANNHAMDYEGSGLADTLRLLKEAKIAAVGVGKNRDDALKPVVLIRRGKSIVFFAFSCVVPPRAAAEVGPGIARLKTDEDFQLASEGIGKARKTADFVIVSVHWGKQLMPRSHSGQQMLAHRLIQAGADVILGHHPHVLQETEVYRRQPIVYSMGNFVFGGSGRSAIFELHLKQPHTVSLVRRIPIIIRNGRPELARGASYGNGSIGLREGSQGQSQARLQRH